MIDCLLIGPNELKVNKQARVLSMIGSENSIASRILMQKTIRVNKQTFNASGVIPYIKERNCESYFSLSMPHILSRDIISLGSYLYSKGITSIDYVNLFLRQKEELIEKLSNNEILTIAITTTSYTTPEPIWEIISFIKKYNKEAKIIVGAPFFTQGEILSKNQSDIKKLFETLDADVYIDSNQGQESLYQTIKAIKNAESLDHIPNLFYKSGNNYIATYKKVEQANIECPMDNWELFGDKVGDFAYIKTSHSCPFTCAFCEFKQREGKYENVDVDLIENQLNAIEKYTKVKSVIFVDDTFNFPPERFKSILKMMIKNQYSFKWSSFFRCQNVDEETLQLMKESGCEFLRMGLESGNQQILNNMNKRTSVEEYYKGIELINKYGIPHWTSFIAGFPGETYESVKDTMKLIETAKPMFYKISPWYFSPFTPIAQEREKYDLTGGRYSWKHKTMDAETAMNLCDEMVLNIRNSVNLLFTAEDLISLTHQGISIEQIKTFSKYFNEGVKERIKNSKNQEVNIEIMKSLENCVCEWDKSVI